MCYLKRGLNFDTSKALFFFPFLANTNEYVFSSYLSVMLKIIMCSQGTYLLFKEHYNYRILKTGSVGEKNGKLSEI